jgi:hypothetical protein
VSHLLRDLSTWENLLPPRPQQQAAHQNQNCQQGLHGKNLFPQLPLLPPRRLQLPLPLLHPLARSHQEILQLGVAASAGLGSRRRKHLRRIVSGSNRSSCYNWSGNE